MLYGSTYSYHSEVLNPVHHQVQHGLAHVIKVLAELQILQLVQEKGFVCIIYDLVCKRLQKLPLFVRRKSHDIDFFLLK